MAKQRKLFGQVPPARGQWKLQLAGPAGVPSGPAPGFRDAGSRTGGRLYEVGFSGYGWSSTEAGTNARFLYFYSGGLVPRDSNGRGYGFQLRCLQE